MSIDFLPSPFNRLQPADLVTHKLKRGEVLFTQESPTAGLYYLSAGIIDLKRSSESGHDILIHRARKDETFAEASLFSDRYHCTATAQCESQVTECRRASIECLLKSDFEFTRSMVARYAVQIQECRRRVELLSIRSADERILAAIADGLLAEDISSFAGTIGLASETVYRSLAALSRDGRIAKTARGRYKLAE